MKQPGNVPLKLDDYNCKTIEEKIKLDNNSLYNSSFNQKCRNGYYKIASVVDPSRSYHFYRQNKNGSWTHKPGSQKVTNLDASNNVIMNPKKADRDYSKISPNKLNYSKFCGYYCIKNNNMMKPF